MNINKFTFDFCFMHFLCTLVLQLGMSIYVSIELALFNCCTLKLPTNDPLCIGI